MNDPDAALEPPARDRVVGAPSADDDRGSVVHAPTETEVPVVATAAATDDRQTGAPERWGSAWREMLGGPIVVSVLAVFASFVVGAVLIAATSERVQAAAGYFFARPTDTLQAIWFAVRDGYVAMFEGSVLNFARADDGFLRVIEPFINTLTYATPLIAAGLGVTVAFRIGLFNIGGRGQMLVSAAAAGWISFAVPLPPVLHMLAAVLGGIVAGALWAGIAGYLKARTGAHEVITTIMLNYVAFYFVTFLLQTPGLLQDPAGINPETPPILPSAAMPPLLGAQFKLTWGLVLALAAVVLAWWLLERSSLGFQFRTLGLNPNAAVNAGMNVPRLTTIGMLIAGGFMGLAGAVQAQATFPGGFGNGVDAGIGFDAITVALLGRSRAWGTLAAAILFGAFRAGGYRMQAAEGIPVDIVLVVQSMIVLFIAAPPLVRAMFRLPKPKGANA